MYDLFEAKDNERFDEQLGADEPWHDAVASITRVLVAGHAIQIQFSGGKDSSCCANLVLSAARAIVSAKKECPPIHVCSADTGVENPVARALAEHELKKMQTYGMVHGIPLQVHIARPTLSASYAVRVVGGRALPPFPVGKKDCAIDFKVLPSQRISKRVRLQAADEAMPLVTVIGTRSAESRARAINTTKRGESSTDLWYGPDGDARLSPILRWSTDEVWCYLGLCASGELDSYSDFVELIEFYSAAAGGECVVVADMRQQHTSPCGARSGCWVCGAVQNDTSVENMIESDPQKYKYLQPLHRFRNFVVKSQWDWSLRNYLGRTIDQDGFMNVKADQFSPQMCELLLRYLLTAQDKANEMGSPIRINAIGMRELFAIDFYWSVRAWHPPFHALAIYLEHERGNRTEAPEIASPVRPSPVPVVGKIHVGSGWDDGSSALRPNGLRDPNWEMHSESCGPSLRQGRDGSVFLDLDEMPEFTVDAEGACLFLDFEVEDMIRKYHQPDTDWTMAASIYLRYGVVKLASGQSSGIDSMIRRSQWIQRQGLHGHQSLENLEGRCTKTVPDQEGLFA